MPDQYSKGALSEVRAIASPLRPREARPISFGYQRRVFLFSLFSSLPAVAVAVVLLWISDYSLALRIVFTVVLGGAWIAGSVLLRQRVIYPLQTVSNMVAALREEDYSFRLRSGSRGDAIGELSFQLNSLADLLQNQRFGAMEAVALLKKVLLEIDVAVFAFDPTHRLVLVNRAGEQLLALTSERALRRTAEELHLDELLRMDPSETVQYSFPGGEGRWALQHSSFRESGIPHELLLVSDLSRALREEERIAWQRLIRVLGHELNNSLAPIKSIAGTLRSMTGQASLPADWNQDLQRGLEVIEGRADSLNRFMQTCTQLARLPIPTLAPVEVEPAIARAARAETRLHVDVAEGERLVVQADRIQLEQLLINIIRNAADAALDPAASSRAVSVKWRRQEKVLSVTVLDQGPGILNDKNLFVPFFTTKPGGSGIGLVLSRQIAELHGGSLKLKNRTDSPGCEAELRLPIAEPDQAGVALGLEKESFSSGR